MNFVSRDTKLPYNKAIDFRGYKPPMEEACCTRDIDRYTAVFFLIPMEIQVF
jgi:hypothetical protein